MELAPTYLAENLSNPSITFPLRLRQGLLQKTDERDAYLMMLGIMARTPRGSWPGHSLFGFQDFFPEITDENLSQESRTRMAETITEEINTVLTDLGLTRYRVDSLTLEPLERVMQASNSVRPMGYMSEGRNVTLMLREVGSNRAIGYAL
jgi:hypothetical protein